MNYFIISQDERVRDAVEPMGISQVVTKEMLTKKKARDINRLNLQFEIKEQDTTEYVDFIEKPVPLLSDRGKQIIEKYVPKLYVKSVVLKDMKKLRQELYWLIVPPRIDCLSEQSEFHKDGTLKRLVIDESKAAPYKVFKIEGIMEEYILISLDVAESLLRREFTGIRLKKVEKEIVERRG